MLKASRTARSSAAASLTARTTRRQALRTNLSHQVRALRSCWRTTTTSSWGGRPSRRPRASARAPRDQGVRSKVNTLFFIFAKSLLPNDRMRGRYGRSIGRVRSRTVRLSLQSLQSLHMIHIGGARGWRRVTTSERAHGGRTAHSRGATTNARARMASIGRAFGLCSRCVLTMELQTGGTYTHLFRLRSSSRGSPLRC